MKTTILHGTPAGYRAHLRAGTAMCGDCRAANREDLRTRPKSERPPIDHGTLRGWRQHKHRKENPCRQCLEAKRQHEQTKPVGEATNTQQAWNKGRVGAPKVPVRTTVIEECTVTGCGAPASQAKPSSAMVHVAVHGSTEPARWYCLGRCRAIGQALAEIRAIRMVAV